MGQVRSQKSFWIVWDLRLDAIFLPKVFSLSIPKRLFSFARILRQALAEFLSQSKSNDSFGECGILSTWPNDNFDCAIKFARCPSTTGIQRQVWGQAADSSNGLHTFPNRILNDSWTILMQLMQKAGIFNRFLWMNRSRFVPTILDKGMLFFAVQSIRDGFSSVCEYLEKNSLLNQWRDPPSRVLMRRFHQAVTESVSLSLSIFNKDLMHFWWGTSQPERALDELIDFNQFCLATVKRNYLLLTIWVRLFFSTEKQRIQCFLSVRRGPPGSSCSG